MSAYRLAAIFIAAQCVLSSAAVVRNGQLRAETASHKTETLTFSELIFNNTMTRFVEHEMSMTQAPPPPVNKVMYVIFAMIFGCCGCDRCYMGQILAGCLKGFTFGGFFIWHMVDYFTCVYCALAKMEKIDMMGYHNTFQPSTVENAFYLCVILLIAQAIQYIHSLQVQRAQLKMQNEMLEQMQKDQEGARPEVPTTQVPLRHQLSGHMPTPFMKALRKAGVVTKDATIPELLAAFQSMDKDGDGKIDHDELKEALASMGVSDEDVDAMIKGADTDGDGKIDKDEFFAFHAKKIAEEKAEGKAED